MQPPSEAARTGRAKRANISWRFIEHSPVCASCAYRVIRLDNGGNARIFRQFNGGIATPREALCRPARPYWQSPAGGSGGGKWGGRNNAPSGAGPSRVKTGSWGMCAAAGAAGAGSGGAGGSAAAGGGGTTAGGAGVLHAAKPTLAISA